MNQEQLVELRAKALGDPACAPFIESRDCQKLAELLSVGRTKLNNVEIGYGTILEVVGIADGNALIRNIKADTNFEFVVPLMDQGRLRIGSPVAQGAVQSFVARGWITQPQADAIKTVGRSPDPVTPMDVAAALFTE